MKGLIIKDFYMMSKYCRMFLIFIAAFMLYSVFDRENFFFQIYPVIIVGMTPMTLYSYDEREHWCTYCQTLPVSRRQYVTAKYAVGFLSVMTLVALIAIFRFAVHGMEKGFLAEDYLIGLLMMLMFGFTAQALILPFLFKFGAEKGRLIYILMIVILSAAMGTLMELQKIQFTKVQGMPFAAFGCLIILAVYIFSWFLSVKFYEKREM